ncbi:MAG: HAD family hydrolase, partial [Exiguobacterium sp.]
MDTVKPDAMAAIEQLKRIGIKTVMLSGDRREVATKIGGQLGLDEVRGELLPHEKVEAIERMIDTRKV